MDMDKLFAGRICQVQESFIREILKVTKRPDIISFAGGLPNPKFFPVQEMAAAVNKVLQQDGQQVLQYSTSEGYLPLREYIADRYWRRYRLRVQPDEILITNGSQQGLDLIGKVFLDAGDQVGLESPGYLGAIQAFALYEPQFQAVPVDDTGLDIEILERVLAEHRIKLFYAVPNFQNPSGITYPAQNRAEVARLLKQYQVALVEDDPYGELRFGGEAIPSMRQYLKNQVLMLGSFSKVVAPGVRLGWICAPEGVMKKLVIAKQAADLHSNYLAQRAVYQYLQDYDLDSHLAKIREGYQVQRDLMMSLIETIFPAEVQMTRPEGGMFLWLTLPEGLSSLRLFEIAADLNVAFVPGTAFYVDGGGHNALRLNFSNADEGQIELGMKRLAQAIEIGLDVIPTNQ